MKYPKLAMLLAGLLVFAGCDQRAGKKQPIDVDPQSSASVNSMDPTYYAAATQSNAPRSESAKPVERIKTIARMAVFGPQQGGLAWLGKSYLQGVELAREQFAKSKRAELFELEIDEADSAGGLGALDQVVQRGPGNCAVVIGHATDSEAHEALGAVYHRRQVLSMPLVAGGEELWRDNQVYVVGTEDRYYGLVLAELVKKLGWSRFNMLLDDSEHAKRVVDTLAHYASKIGLERGIAATFTDENDVETKARMAMVENAPQGIVIVSRDPERMQLALSFIGGQQHQGQARIPVLASDGAAAAEWLDSKGTFDYPIFVASAFDPNAAAASEFVAKYRERNNGFDPDLYTALAYDATTIFCESLRPDVDQVDAAQFEQHLRRAYKAESPFQGVTGPIAFDAHGRAMARQVSLLEYRDGRLHSHSTQLTEEERRAIDVQALATDEPVVSQGTGNPPQDPPVDPQDPPRGQDPLRPQQGGARPRPQHGELVWHQTLDDALDESDESGKPILVDFFSVTCGPCMQMEKTTWISPEFAEAAKGWVLLRFDLDNRAVGRHVIGYRVRDLPAIGFFTPCGCVASIEATGFKDGPAMVALMNRMKTQVDQLSQQAERLRKRLEEPNMVEQPEAHLELGTFYIEKLNYSEAIVSLQTTIALYEAASKNNPRAEATYSKLLEAQAKSLRYEDCVRTADEFLQKYPNSQDKSFADMMAVFALSIDGRCPDAKARMQKMIDTYGANDKRTQNAVKYVQRYCKE
jgi:ABC-type branched-subunit amino acid transport system substrate-binding protein/thiol-disulfide isomerase/thioredoxin